MWIMTSYLIQMHVLEWELFSNPILANQKPNMKNFIHEIKEGLVTLRLYILIQWCHIHVSIFSFSCSLCTSCLYQRNEIFLKIRQIFSQKGLHCWKITNILSNCWYIKLNFYPVHCLCLCQHLLIRSICFWFSCSS